MSTHAESSDGFVVGIDREIFGNKFGQFLGDVGEHLVMFLGGIGGGINIVTG